jgi:hypothetical protein
MDFFTVEIGFNPFRACHYPHLSADFLRFDLGHNVSDVD